MAFVPRKLKSITLPLIKMANNKPYYLKLTGEIFVGKKIGDKEPAKLVNVIDLEDGAEAQIILGTVLYGILTENYPDGGYVDHCFEIVKFRDAGSDYNTYNVAEIADPADDEDKQGETAAKSGKKK